MKGTSLLLPFCGILLPLIDAKSIHGGFRAHGDTHKHNLARSKDTGSCPFYPDATAGSDETKPSCKVWCKETTGSDSTNGCIGPDSMDTNDMHLDEYGEAYWLGKCQCGFSHPEPDSDNNIKRSPKGGSRGGGGSRKPPKKDDDDDKKEDDKKEDDKKEDDKKEDDKKEDDKKEDDKKEDDKKEDDKKEDDKKEDDKKDDPKKDDPKKDDPKKDDPKKDPKKGEPCKLSDGSKGIMGRKGCKTRCGDVVAWEPGELPSDDEDDDSADDLQQRGLFGLQSRAQEMNYLAKRDKKNVAVCGFEIKTENFRSSGDIRKEKLGADSIYAYEDAKHCDNFDFGKRSTSLYATKYTNLNHNLGLATEHVLEAQLVKLFFEDISKGKSFPNPFTGGGQVDLCGYIKAYWESGTSNAEIKKSVTPATTVTKAGKVETVSATTTTTATVTAVSGVPKLKIDGKTESGPKHIANQYPTTKFKQEEFLLLHGSINGLKMEAWADKSLVADDRIKSVIQAPLKDNDFLKKSHGKSDFIKAILKFKDIIAAYEYHLDSRVQDILKAQTDRVGAMLDKVEDALADLTFTTKTTTVTVSVNNKEVSKTPETQMYDAQEYEPQELKAAWQNFMKKRAKEVMARFEEFLKKHWSEYEAATKRLEKMIDPKKNTKKNTKNLSAKEKKKMKEQEDLNMALDLLEDLKKYYDDTMKKGKGKTIL